MQQTVFRGTVEELMVRAASVGLSGEWQERPGMPGQQGDGGDGGDGGERFTLAMADGVALHWTPSDARLWLEGPEAAVAAVSPRVAEALADP